MLSASARVAKASPPSCASTAARASSIIQRSAPFFSAWLAPASGRASTFAARTSMAAAASRACSASTRARASTASAVAVSKRREMSSHQTVPSPAKWLRVTAIFRATSSLSKRCWMRRHSPPVSSAWSATACTCTPSASVTRSRTLVACSGADAVPSVRYQASKIQCPAAKLRARLRLAFWMSFSKEMRRLRAPPRAVWSSSAKRSRSPFAFHESGASSRMVFSSSPGLGRRLVPSRGGGPARSKLCRARRLSEHGLFFLGCLDHLECRGCRRSHPAASLRRESMNCTKSIRARSACASRPAGTPNRASRKLASRQSEKSSAMPSARFT